MRNSLSNSPWSLRRLRLLVVAVGLTVLAAGPFMSRAQDPNPPGTAPEQAASEPAAPDRAPAGQPKAASPVAPALSGPNLPSVWNLAVQGGIFMIPIAVCSIVVLAFSLERFFGLRGKKIVPPKLLVALQKLNSEETGMDPRQAYEVCQAHPSPLANVIRTAILKIGRPHAELEKAVEDAVAREADVMAHNIRPINVSASLSPLIGLLGTVQGMIMAFMVTSSTTSTGAAKAQELAQGIYTALVTTFAGLCVAIPAVLLANMLEGRIERLLRDMEDMFLEVLPQFERFEGKFRVTRKAGSSGVLLKGTTAANKPSTSLGKPTPSTPVKPIEPAAPTDEDEAIAEFPAAAEPKSLWGVMGAREKAGKDS
jgi:biopolymer transport protein ExbB